MDPTFQPPDQYVSVEEYQYEFDSDLDDDDDDDSDDIQNTESCDLHKSNGRGHDESVMEPREEPAVPDDLKVTSEVQQVSLTIFNCLTKSVYIISQLGTFCRGSEFWCQSTGRWERWPHCGGEGHGIQDVSVSFTAVSSICIVLTSYSWQSLIFYIYTGQLEFAPLRSQIPAIRDVNGKATERNRSYQPPSCSPKSMYRLADKVLA